MYLDLVTRTLYIEVINETSFPQKWQTITVFPAGRWQVELQYKRLLYGTGAPQRLHAGIGSGIRCVERVSKFSLISI